MLCNNNSITSLGNISGDPQSKLYGAQIVPAERYVPHFERNYTYTLVAPWKAEKEERTFMNRLKEMNEPIVKTYRDIKLYPIEGFGNKKKVNWWFILFVLVCVVVYNYFSWAK